MMQREIVQRQQQTATEAQKATTATATASAPATPARFFMFADYFVAASTSLGLAKHNGVEGKVKTTATAASAWRLVLLQVAASPISHVVHLYNKGC
mmetsp:Transcript_101042/g.195469  ORF Transcript_101042/g.195469 Transcript_101042/m.195469 type:complete len:96 (-) Transcript_101042:1177-1464(-)